MVVTCLLRHRIGSNTKVGKTVNLLFIIRVKGELKRVYRNGCRYNERLNTENTLGCEGKHTVNLVLVVTQ
jgi:hypothetical protein